MILSEENSRAHAQGNVLAERVRILVQAKTEGETIDRRSPLPRHLGWIDDDQIERIRGDHFNLARAGDPASARNRTFRLPSWRNVSSPG